jgi:hypothetical protein
MVNGSQPNTNYDRDETIPLCHDCHMDVHQKPGFSDELCPHGQAAMAMVIVPAAKVGTV